MRVWDRKSAGRARVGRACGLEVCGAGAGWEGLRVGSVRGGSGEDFSNSCVAGADTKFQPAQDPIVHALNIS